MLLAMAASVLMLPAGAADEVWRAGGPYFSSMHGLAFGPTGQCSGIVAQGPSTTPPGQPATPGATERPMLYAATDNGVWATCDGSGQWRSLEAVIWSSSVAVDPSRASNLYVAGQSFALRSGLLRSTDGGTTWQVPQSGLPHAWYNTVKVDANRPSTVLVGGVGGVYRSADFGAHWQVAAGIDPSAYIASLAISAATANLAFAAGSGGVYRSVDGGSQWSVLGGGLPAGGFGEAVVIHATRITQTVFAAVNGAIWRSADRGDSWALVDTLGLPEGYVKGLAVDPSATSPAILYALSYVFSSGTWSVFRSADGGTWSLASPSLPASDQIVSIAVNPRTPSTVYATSTATGLQTSRDSGQTWATTSRSLRGEVSRVAVAPTAPHTVYAGSYDSGPFKSLDGGKNWVAIPQGLGPDVYGSTMGIQALAVSPVDAATAYVGTCCGVFRTQDGTRWSPMNDGIEWLPQVQALAIDPTAPNTLYAGTLWGNLWKTSDGQHWNWSGAGLPGAHVYAIAIDPRNPATVYVSSYDGSEGPPDTRAGYGVYKSTDGGASWVPMNVGLSNPLVRVLAVDPVDPMTVYAGTTGSGIFKSVNGGVSWSASGTGAGMYPSTILVDPSAPSTVYASTYDLGVFRSTDGGRTWSALNRGLDVPTTQAQWMAIDPSTAGRLYLATMTSGVTTLRGSGDDR